MSWLNDYSGFPKGANRIMETRKGFHNGMAFHLLLYPIALTSCTARSTAFECCSRKNLLGPPVAAVPGGAVYLGSVLRLLSWYIAHWGGSGGPSWNQQQLGMHTDSFAATLCLICIPRHIAQSFPKACSFKTSHRVLLEQLGEIWRQPKTCALLPLSRSLARQIVQMLVCAELYLRKGTTVCSNSSF